ncbi:MAG: Zn-dependent alcohol dehydrogenase [Actinomycetia bacterium]|nr:Zn-dependent alcohol dehydrogenase [Actinomycetes bacterium]MCP4083653.1 Zn-dependent alcohol dehydrogenase [Actinomycetes bacterium]
MKAAVLNQIPGDLEIEDISVDKPAANEVLLQTTNAGLCHSDLHFMDGSWNLLPVPSVMGHESAGIVQAVGSDVQYVKPGDHVITCLSVFCGHCEFCLTGRPNLCNNNAATSRPDDASPRLFRGDTPVGQFARLGGFAEEMLVHQNALVKIREDMPLDKASLIGCGVTTGMGAAIKTAKVEPGTTVAVIGAGGIGLSAIQGARIAGANRIIAVDITNEKLDTARVCGATDTVNSAEVDDAVAAVMEMTGGGVDYAFEAIGRKETVEQAWSMSRTGGTSVVIGMMPFGQKIEITGYEIFMQEKTLKGSMMGSNAFRVDMPRYIDMYLDGRLKLDEMISHTIALEEINEGYEMMKRGEGARTVINF